MLQILKWVSNNVALNILTILITRDVLNACNDELITHHFREFLRHLNLKLLVLPFNFRNIF